MTSNNGPVRTPSTMGNFGPGFDATAIALAWGGDALTLEEAAEDGVTVTGRGAQGVPESWAENCACAAIDYLRQRTGVDAAYHLTIEKGVLPGSGLGSSASSSAGGALAFARRHRDEHEFTAELLVEAAAYGEARVAGAHADDVAAAVMGGLALVRRGEVRRIQPPEDLWLAITLPRLRLETRVMRKAVGERVTVPDAVANLANVAFLVDAIHRGDVQCIGRSLDERIATPGRRRYLPYFDATRKAALAEGAYGCALSGSGPAMFAVHDDGERAEAIAEAMAEAVRDEGLDADAIACQAERRVVIDEVLLH